LQRGLEDLPIFGFVPPPSSCVRGASTFFAFFFCPAFRRVRAGCDYEKTRAAQRLYGFDHGFVRFRCHCRA
jgi:hypothetical protein